jgi:uncharacterized protein (TIGR03435 family)
MEGLARNLPSRAGRVIFDRTGLEGYYQIALTFAPDIAADAADAPTLFTALQEQLGLKREPSRAPLQTLRIDRVERPTSNSSTAGIAQNGFLVPVRGCAQGWNIAFSGHAA